MEANYTANRTSELNRLMDDQTMNGVDDTGEPSDFNETGNAELFCFNLKC